MLRPSRKTALHSPCSLRLVCDGATPRISLRYVKVHSPVRRMILSAVDGLHHQTVGTGLPVVYFHFHSYRDHGISLLYEIIGANKFREKYLLVGRSLENAVGHAHNRRGRRGQQRLIDFRVQNYVVRMLKAIAAGRNDLQALDYQRGAVFE